MVDIVLAVTYFAILLGFGILIANYFKKRKLPDVIFLLLLGLILGPTVFAHPLVTKYIDITLVDLRAMGDIPDFIRLLALILIVFTGTFSINTKVFKKYSSVSLKLAVAGPIINTLLIGIAANLILGLDWVYALLLGAILSGTGEAVIYSFQPALTRYKNSATILLLESIFNSPLAVLLPLLLLGFLELQPGELLQPLKYISQFWQLIAAGIGTGIVIGYGVSRIFKKTKGHTVLLLFSIALITFALAESVGGSGILAVAVAGLIVGNLSFPEKEDVIMFDDYFSEMLRIAIFTMFGAQILLFVTFQQIFLSLMFFLAVLLARVIFVLPAARKNHFTSGDKVLLNFVAPKGIEVTATAPIVAAAIFASGQSQIATTIINTAFLVLLYSILLSTVVAIAMTGGAKKGAIDKRKSKIFEKAGKEDRKYVQKPSEVLKAIDKAERLKEKEEKAKGK